MIACFLMVAIMEVTVLLCVEKNGSEEAEKRQMSHKLHLLMVSNYRGCEMYNETLTLNSINVAGNPLHLNNNDNSNTTNTHDCLSGKDSDGVRNATSHKQEKKSPNNFMLQRNQKTVCDFGEEHIVVVSFILIFLSFF